MRGYGLCLGAALEVLGLAGYGQALELQLQYKMKPGQEFQYRDWLVLASQTFGEEVPEETRYQLSTDAVYQQRVVSLENGVFELENRTLHGQMKVLMGGQEHTEEMKERTEVVRLDERGKVLSRKEVGEEEKEEQKESLMDPNFPLCVLDEVYENLLFPRKAVKMGESWIDQARIKITPESSVSVDLTSKVVRLVKVRGRPCTEIKTHFVVPVNGSEGKEGGPVKISVEGQIAGNLTLYFDYEKGIDQVHLGEINVILNTKIEAMEMVQETQAKTKIRLKSVLQEEK